MPTSLHDVIPSENHLLEDVTTLFTYFGSTPKEPVLGNRSEGLPMPKYDHEKGGERGSNKRLCQRVR